MRQFLASLIALSLLVSCGGSSSGDKAPHPSDNTQSQPSPTPGPELGGPPQPSALEIIEFSPSADSMTISAASEAAIISVKWKASGAVGCDLFVGKDRVSYKNRAASEEVRGIKIIDSTDLTLNCFSAEGKITSEVKHFELTRKTVPA
ncbi:MAG: hypothetical protein EOP09_02005, partial [Proteobacteria bacterium]